MVESKILHSPVLDCAGDRCKVLQVVWWWKGALEDGMLGWAWQRRHGWRQRADGALEVEIVASRADELLTDVFRRLDAGVCGPLASVLTLPFLPPVCPLPLSPSRPPNGDCDQLT